MNRQRRYIRQQKEFLDNLYNNITSSSLRPTNNTYAKAAMFNHVKDGYEFMAGPYRRQGFPENAQIQTRLDYVRSPAGQKHLQELSSSLSHNEMNVAKSIIKRMKNKGKTNLLKKIRNLELDEIETPTITNSLTENNYVLINSYPKKGGRRNCTIRRSRKLTKKRN